MTRPPDLPLVREALIHRALNTLVSRHDVTAAVLVDPEGYVTHARQGFALDEDALGGSLQLAFHAVARASRELRQSAPRWVVAENDRGVLLLLGLDGGFLLAVVAEPGAKVDALRAELAANEPELTRLFAGRAA